MGSLNVGSRVNLERALRLSDRLGGHLVSGHIDGLATVEERRTVGDFTLFIFSLDPGLTKYVIEKGSITINGVSLTVNSCEHSRFSVSIIPHTLSTTTLGDLKQGDKVNIEVDIIGKYVEKLLGGNVNAQSGKSVISSSFLAEHGFL
jgi:riboflavin synthase